MFLLVQKIIKFCFIILLSSGIFTLAYSQEKSTPKEFSWQPIFQLLAKEKFDKLGICRLSRVDPVAKKGNNTSFVVGQALICTLKIGEEVRIWHKILNYGAGNEVAPVILDAVLHEDYPAFQIFTVFADGSLIGLLEYPVLKVVKFNPQGKKEWEYEIKIQSYPNLSGKNIKISKTQDGYLILAYDLNGLKKSTIQDNLPEPILPFTIIKINDQGKQQWSQDSNFPVLSGETFLSDNEQGINIWSLENDSMAVSLITQKNNEASDNLISLHFFIGYYTKGYGWTIRDFSANEMPDFDWYFNIDKKGYMDFLAFNIGAKQDYEFLYQLGLTIVDPRPLTSQENSPKIKWQYQFTVDRPFSDDNEGAFCLYPQWVMGDEESYMVLCQQQYVRADDKNMLMPVEDKEYERLLFWELKKDGTLINKKTILAGIDFKNILRYEEDGQSYKYHIISPVVINRRLIFGLSKFSSTVPISKQELQRLLSLNDDKKLADVLDLKIYDFQLP